MNFGCQVPVWSLGLRGSRKYHPSISWMDEMKLKCFIINRSLQYHHQIGRYKHLYVLQRRNEAIKAGGNFSCLRINQRERQDWNEMKLCIVPGPSHTDTTGKQSL